MANIHIKTAERRSAEATTLREFGVGVICATAEQREYAEQIAADNRSIDSIFRRMEEKSE